MIGSPTRDELRQAYADAWRKHSAGALLSPLETMLADIVGLHPEYHAVVRDATTARDFEPTTDAGENPFLHMSLHMAVREQLSVDRPPGVRELHRHLATRLGDAHGAEHALMESLAETLWEAQRSGVAPDETHYLERARRRLKVVVK